MCYEETVRRALAGGLAVVAAAAFAGGAFAGNQKGTTYVDEQDGYSLTIPSTWQLIPRTVAEVKARIATLKKTKSTVPLADTYQSIISSAAGRSALKAYRLQAFLWPMDGSTPLLTEVSLGVVPTSKAYAEADLPRIGATYADALAQNKGSKVAVPKLVKLPSGAAEFVQATIPAGEGLTNGVELYLIPHGKRLYELSFQVDARYLKSATLFTSIAEHFRLR
jgi:hypothetical protein